VPPVSTSQPPHDHDHHEQPERSDPRPGAGCHHDYDHHYGAGYDHLDYRFRCDHNYQAWSRYDHYATGIDDVDDRKIACVHNHDNHDDHHCAADDHDDDDGRIIDPLKRSVLV